METLQQIATKTLVLTCVLAIGPFGLAHAQESATVNDSQIHAIHYEELDYPPLAKTAAVQGVVVVRVKLDSAGNVAAAEAISGDEALTTTSLANAKKWRFRPNPRKRAIIVYNFTLSSHSSQTGSAACGDVHKYSTFTFQRPNFVTITPCPTIIDHGGMP